MRHAGWILLTLVAAVGIIAVVRHWRRSAPAQMSRIAPMSIGVEDDADARDEMEFLMLRDPRTGIIPRDIRVRELRFARSLPIRGPRISRNGPNRMQQTQALTWTERGPNNVGGRTRTLAVDVSAP